MTKKAVLAFSGGLDTSVVVKYLQEKYDMDVVTVTVDVGQGDDQKKITAKAKSLELKNITTLMQKKNLLVILFFLQSKQTLFIKKNIV